MVRNGVRVDGSRNGSLARGPRMTKRGAGSRGFGFASPESQPSQRGSRAHCRATNAAGVCWNGSPEGRAGQCLRKCVFCPCRVSAGMGKGVALTARGPELAGWRPHPTGVGLARTRSWLIHRPLFGALRPGCPGRGSGLDPRELLWARIPARTLHALLGDAGPLRRDRPGSSHRARHVRHRPGPLAPALARMSRTDRDPARWLALHGARKSAARQRNRVGHRLPGSAPCVETRPSGAFPSAWPETLARPSGSGSATMIACGWRVGKRSGDFWLSDWICWNG